MNFNFLTLNNRHLYVLVVALLQSIALLGLHHWVQALTNFSEHLNWILPLYTFALLFPVSLMLLAHVSRQQVLVLTFVLSMVMALCGAHVGYVSYVPKVTYGGEAALFLFGLSVFVVWFVAVVFIEHFCVFQTWCKNYIALHDFAWRNTVKLLTAAIFVGLFWAALALLAGLFSILKIKFFADLITNHYFAYPATTFAFGVGLSLYAAKESALTEFKRATLQVFGWLLPMVSLIVLGFAAALAVSGLSLLWSTGYATNLMLCLMFLMVFLFNAVFQDGDAPQYPSWVLNLSNIGLIVLPLYGVLSMYAVYLRVHQYGWTVDRVWAAVLVMWASVYAWGYAVSTYQSFKSTVWMQYAKSVNIFSAILVVSLLVMVNSPILSPMRISVQSQVDRLLEGKVRANDFDFEYLRFHGGQYGQQALRALMDNQQVTDAIEVKQAVSSVLEQTYPKREFIGAQPKRNLANLDEFKKGFAVYPSGQVLDEALLKVLYEEYTRGHQYNYCFGNSSSSINVDDCSILMVDLNQDSVLEAVISEGRGDYFSGPELYVKNPYGWVSKGFMVLLNNRSTYERAYSTSIEQGDYKTVAPPTWQVLQIGKQQYMVGDCCADQ